MPLFAIPSSVNLRLPPGLRQELLCPCESAREANGVGNNPNTGTLMGRTEVASAYSLPFRVIPEFGQISKDNV